MRHPHCGETVRLTAHLCVLRHSLARGTPFAAGKGLILRSRVLLSAAKMKIRLANLSDAPVITDFNLRLALETEDLRLDPACVARGVAALLKDPAKGLYYLAVVDSVVAGQLMITYEWSDWRNGNLWWIQSVYVKEEFRQRGVFRALFEHLRQLAQQQQDVRALRLYMHADNVRARRSYERLGMSRTKYEVFELDIPAHPVAPGIAW
jgi:GNAT superfamily N-acetyltransferase